jgi:murein DD-endopeptidase MepM/ murein hydrolase activator NlpD
MRAPGRRRPWTAAPVAALAAAGLVALSGPGVPAAAQVLPPILQPPPAPDPTATTSPPPAEGAPPPPEAPAPVEGDAGHDHRDPASPRLVPAAAQAAIDGIARTAPGNNEPLVAGVAALEAAGVPHDEAVRAAYGPFPVLGPTRWVDDWHYPRWSGATFRYHKGLDMFAAYGTPVAAPADGTARIASNALGGLTVRVVEPDGSYWYLAHLSGIAEGLVDGQAVSVGDVVGFVGTSGNARGTPPHLHLGHYVAGTAVPPKPSVDGWVLDGAAHLAELLALLAGTDTGTLPVATPLRTAPRVTPGVPAPALSRTELLWASASSANGGALALADSAAAAAGRRVAWEARAAEERALQLGWDQSADAARTFLAPLVNAAVRRAVELRREAAAISRGSS